MIKRRQVQVAISIHTPVKGVTVGPDPIDTGDPDFNPHTREGCDVWGRDPATPHVISIHTPVKGVTVVDRGALDLLFDISIHTPVKGVTSRPECRPRFSDYFNPHTREGCDGIAAGARSASGLFQSTHP